MIQVYFAIESRLEVKLKFIIVSVIIIITIIIIFIKHFGLKSIAI